MTDGSRDRIVDAIIEHGNSIGQNLVFLKTFMQAERKAQEEFLTEQREASERAQEKAYRTARWSMLATFFAAAAAVFQAYTAYVSDNRDRASVAPSEARSADRLPAPEREVKAPEPKREEVGQ